MSWRRWLLWCLAGLLVLMGSGLAYLFWDRHKANVELQTVAALLDKADVGWRLEDIEKNRRVVPDEKNVALFASAALRLLPENWQPKTPDDLQETPPQFRLQAEAATQLRVELAARADALAASRTMASHSMGRFAVDYEPDFYSTKFTDQTNTRYVAQLLVLDVYDALEEKQPERALQAIEAVFNLGRCFEDDALLISQILRVAIQSMAIHCLERTMAQATIAEKDSARMQRLLSEEAAAEIFVFGMRGERAGVHRCLNHLAARDGPVTIALKGLAGDPPIEPSMWDYGIDIYARTVVCRSNTAMLNHYTKILEAAKRPGSARYVALREIAAEPRELVQLSTIHLTMPKLLTAPMLKIADMEQRIDTHLHCAIAGVAAERFRIKHSRWPNSLDELVEAKFLAAVPEDLYDGQPVRFRRADDGIVVYSIGKDGDYKGDALDRPTVIDPTLLRTEFRLWDAERRAQPPRPKPQ